jgi:hypothetical protein
VLLAFGGGTAHAQSKCHAGKLKCVVKKKSCLLGLESKELKTGVAADPAKVAKCHIGFGGSCDAGANVDQACTQASDCPGGACVKGCFTKLEAKVPTPPDQACPTSGDATALENKVDAFVADVKSELDLTPGPNLNLCQAGKVKCVIGYDKCVLGVNGKAVQKGLPVDTAKLDKCLQKFGGKCDAGANVGLSCTTDTDCPGGACAGGCFTKLEAKGGCQTTGDVAAEKSKADAFDADVINELANAAPATCPTEIQFTGTSTNGVLDTGWTGNGHDATTITKGTVTVSVSGCSGAAPNCGVCTYAGPLENHAGQLHTQRCKGDSSIQCTNNAACGANAPCVFFFGSNLPLAAGGVSTCVQNIFAGGISGTANVNTSGVGAGTSAGAASLTSIVYSGPTLSNPCPNCNGDPTANDGAQGGICAGGARNGLACDASGSSPNIAFGTTSLDCPPLAGGVIATLPIDLSNTTGTKSRTLSTSNPLCRAPGFTTNRCQCDTCNNAAATPCAVNADCGAGICGGKRCSGGANNGTACAATSECPGGACNVPGAASAPNQCDLGSGDCVPDPGTPSPNDHICSSGPTEQFCGPVETFRGCTTNTDCTRAGDTCSISRNRDCFDNGVVGDVVAATGQADPPSGHQSNPTLAALFCVGPTTAPAVNSAAGLPGLGRLELQGHSTDNGTP